MEFIRFLEEHHVDMTNVKVNNHVEASFTLALLVLHFEFNSTLQIQLVRRFFMNSF